MNIQLYIVLGAFLLFILAILSGKVKIHVAAMVIPIILEMSGVLSTEDAWKGLTNSSVLMMASMFVVGAGLSKTSLISKLIQTFIKDNSSDSMIMLGLAIPIIFLCCFVNDTATIPIMIPLMVQICAEQKKHLSQYMYPAAVLALIWAGAIPTGGNSGGYLGNNTIIENLGGVGTFTYFTNLISKIPFLVIITIFVIWIYPKITPKNGELAEISGSAKGDGKKGGSKLSPEKEKIAMVIFTLTIIGVIICAFTKKSTWWPSMIGALAMVFFGVLTDKEAIKALGSPIIFIFVGTLPLSTALKSTGGDVLIADTFNRLTGGMGAISTMIALYLLCMFLTQFVSNTAVANAFKMIAALIAVQNGFDARALMLAVTMDSANCYLTPMAAPAMTMAYEEGKYEMKQYLKMGLPVSILSFLIFIIYIPLVFL